MPSRSRTLAPRTRDASQDPRWAALQARDPAADGRFVYAVRTTGVYGRPSSAARLPRPENVEFFDCARDAEAAGYRPSRRVLSDRSTIATRHAALVAAACREIESAASAPSLGELASHAIPENCWMAIRGSVYDLSAYLPEHPSRPEVILPWCGKEATEAYNTKTKGRSHKPYADDLLAQYRIGKLAPAQL